VDGVVCGIHQAALLATLRLPKARTGSYASPGAREVGAVSAPIAARFRTSTKS
jgi:hypothetical protein